MAKKMEKLFNRVLKLELKIILILSVYTVISVETVVYDLNTASAKFKFFKNKYDRHYNSTNDELDHKMNFVHNLNKVMEFNKNTNDTETVYVLNKYADIDSNLMKNHHAIFLKPYDKLIGNTNPEELLRIPEIKEKQMEAEDGAVYDLDYSEDLYKEYLKKYNKYYKNKHKRLVHYYRFVKTLVDINRSHFQGNTSAKLDANADIVRNPYDYIY